MPALPAPKPRSPTRSAAISRGTVTPTPTSRSCSPGFWNGSRPSRAVTAGSTRVFAVIGDPVAHSISPAMHGAAFRALGLDAVYVALRASGSDLGPLLRTLCRSDGGASIMAPNKQTAAQLLEAPSRRVADAGGCNAVWGST